MCQRSWVLRVVSSNGIPSSWQCIFNSHQYRSPAVPLNTFQAISTVLSGAAGLVGALGSDRERHSAQRHSTLELATPVRRLRVVKVSRMSEPRRTTSGGGTSASTGWVFVLRVLT